MPPAARAMPTPGDEVDEKVAQVVVALVAGKREHGVAELGRQGRLDLVLGAALGDQVLDVLALLDGLGRLGGQGQGGAADRAHHLVLDVGERGLGTVGGQGRGREGEQQRRQGRGHDHAAQDGPSRSGATWLRMKASSTGPRCAAAMPPRLSITKVSGKPMIP